MQLKGKKPPSREVVLEMLAETYHWTPEEIKQIPRSEMEALLQIMRTKNKLREIAYKK